MNTKRLKVGFAALVIAISTSAFADEIYKWVDQDGNVQYEDRPSGDPAEEQLRVCVFFARQLVFGRS